MGIFGHHRKVRVHFLSQNTIFSKPFLYSPQSLIEAIRPFVPYAIREKASRTCNEIQCNVLINNENLRVLFQEIQIEISMKVFHSTEVNHSYTQV